MLLAPNNTCQTLSFSQPEPSPCLPPKQLNNLLHRRHLLTTTAFTISFNFNLSSKTSLPISDPVAIASGLFIMPPPRLKNQYYLVRSGESEFESMGVINTNPVAKTSVDNGLSDRGKKQSIRAAFDLKEMGACDNNCWIWPAITQRAYQTAEIIASVNSITRSYIVPEYSFLDARGLGAYEGKTLEYVSEIYASDGISTKIKPPPIDDGTPNESVADVFVRVTQLMSILETQYAGDTVVIVSPDSDNLSILQAGLVGLDLRRHRELSFAPGEVRYVDTNDIPTYKMPPSAIIEDCEERFPDEEVTEIVEKVENTLPTPPDKATPKEITNGDEKTEIQKHDEISQDQTEGGEQMDTS